jgi:hypothetical protein
MTATEALAYYADQSPISDPTDGSLVDPQDVPRDRFIVAAAACQACRAGQADPDVEDTRGWPYLRHNLVHDLAA